MKKFIIAFTITLVLCLGSIAGFIAFVDPFYHYHDAPKDFEAYMDNAIYQTPGAADHFKYDSVIVGSSMTENFRESWFEEKGLHTQKLSYSGAEMEDYVTIMKRVFDSGNEVKLVMTDINEFQLTSEPGKIYQERPEYLYDNKWYTDTQYLYNNDVFWITAGRELERISGNQPKKDDSYTWEDAELFGEEFARKDYALFEEQMEKDIAEGTHIRLTTEEFISHANDNIACLSAVIEEHPTTTFIIFYPPFSKLYWDEAIYDDNLDGVLAAFETSMAKLLAYDNVRIYYFQDEEEIITDLNRYRDVGHYEPSVNRYIFDVIMADYLGESKQCEERITQDNLEEHIEAMREIALR